MNSDYQQALNYLDDFINFERKMPDIYKPENVDPDRGARLLGLLGHPQRRFPSIHIAGTKGKGSVAAMCAAALRAAGYRVGLYTSPHLQELRERIRILTPADEEGRISQEEFVLGVGQLRRLAPQVPGITWFELLTALAFWHFARQEVEIAVVEVGLGGRLDATNVLTPLLSLITSISYDHTNLLGHTLSAIAAEKGGIFKPGVPAVLAPQVPEASQRLQALARQVGSPLVVVGRDLQYMPVPGPAVPSRLILADPRQPGSPFDGLELGVGLLGAHQQENAATAVAALRLLQPHFPRLTVEAIRQGLAAVRWPGRLQLLRAPGPGGPGVLLDGAHNGDSAEKLAQALPACFTYRRLFLLVGMTRAKDSAGILRPLLPLAEATVVTRSSHPRAADPALLVQVAKEMGHQVSMAADLEAGFRRLCRQAGSPDLICVTGSLFIVGDLLNQWERLQFALAG